jgi:superfamily I DNA/RNA helicase
VLTRNYRNGEQILRHALNIVAGDQFDDLDTEPVGGKRDVEATRSGGTVIQAPENPAQRGAAMCEYIRRLHARDGVRYGDMAVLAPWKATAARWQEVLTRNEIPALSLEKYIGMPCDQVKVGTFHRAKGLEFAWVFIPDQDQYPRRKSPRVSAEAYRERAELERRILFVAMTRARDGLWLGASQQRGVRPALKGTAPAPYLGGALPNRP